MWQFSRITNLEYVFVMCLYWNLSLFVTVCFSAFLNTHAWITRHCINMNERTCVTNQRHKATSTNCSYVPYMMCNNHVSNMHACTEWSSCVCVCVCMFRPVWHCEMCVSVRGGLQRQGSVRPRLPRQQRQLLSGPDLHAQQLHLQTGPLLRPRQICQLFGCPWVHNCRVVLVTSLEYLWFLKRHWWLVVIVWRVWDFTDLGFWSEAS